MSDQPGEGDEGAGGDGPDPRWSLANERTMLAYERTALGLVVAGFAVAGSHALAEDPPVWLAVVGFPLIVLGAVVAVEGRRRFVEAQRAMRRGEALTTPRAAAILPWGVAAVALLGLVLVVLELLTGS